MLVEELAHSARTWEMPPPLVQERPRRSCTLPLPAFLLLKSGVDGTAFLSKVLRSGLV